VAYHADFFCVWRLGFRDLSWLQGYIIKEYFLNYRLHLSDVTVNIVNGAIDYHRSGAEDWRVSLIETGDATMTGGRIKRIRDYLTDDEAFFLTYGDGVADIDLSKLLAFHKAHGRLATVTSVLPPGRFGALELEGNLVKNFVKSLLVMAQA